MDVSGFGALVAEKLASKKNGGKVGPRQWATQVLEVLRAAIDAGELKSGDVVTASAVLGQLQKNGIAMELKRANSIGDAMGWLGLRRFAPGKYYMPLALPIMKDGVIVQPVDQGPHPPFPGRPIQKIGVTK